MKRLALSLLSLSLLCPMALAGSLDGWGAYFSRLALNSAIRATNPPVRSAMPPTYSLPTQRPQVSPQPSPSPTPSARPTVGGISLRQYNQLSEGMPLTEVEQILGRKGYCRRGALNDEVYTSCTWAAQEGEGDWAIYISFDENERLISREQGRLPD